MIDIKIKILCDNAIVPRYQSSGASGFDFHSIEEVILPPSGILAVKTGLAFEIPLGYEIQVRPRSGLAYKHGISVLNTPGTIDSDYRGEVMIILINTSKESFAIHKGDRIAQGVIAKVYQANLITTQDLEDSTRGDKGFGSTGVR